MTTTKQSIGDSTFRAKLYVGATAAGAWASAIFYLYYISDGRISDVVSLVKYSPLFWSVSSTEIMIVAGAGAGLSWWVAWMILAKPWRDASEVPDAAGDGVEKPW